MQDEVEVVTVSLADIRYCNVRWKLFAMITIEEVRLFHAITTFIFYTLDEHDDTHAMTMKRASTA